MGTGGVAGGGRDSVLARLGGRPLRRVRVEPGGFRGSRARACGGERARRKSPLPFPVQPASGDPYRSEGDGVRDLWRLVYAGLVTHDASLTAVPDLAAEVPDRANGGVSADGRTLTYRVRPGVKWHDGAPVTAADVRATWLYLQAGSPRGSAAPVPGDHGRLLFTFDRSGGKGRGG
ncbi:MAG: hypothetical protein FDZ70_10060 [Actinobacteria bacterium]|nr:MAG: hypothetical protein FDZ70_10060 [Actinomycetota bacterium]